MQKTMIAYQKLLGKKWSNMLIAIDFDGTITKENNFPAQPKNEDLREGTVEVLKRLRDKGHKLILWTCRHGKNLEAALTFCESLGIEFDAVNDNVQETKDKYDSCSNKIYAHVYVDDVGLRGIPNTWYEIEKIIDELEKP